MEIVKRIIRGVPVLDISGTVSVGGTATELAALLSELLEENIPGIVLNLENIDYIDSTGIGELVGYLSRFEDAKKRIVLLNPKERIIRLLQITKLDKVFKIFQEEEKAINYCERGESNPQG